MKKNIKQSEHVEQTKVKKKKHIFLMAILITIVLFTLMHFINMLVINVNNSKMSSNINKLEKYKTSYVFIDINPSFVLTLKDNKVEDVACLNDDCVAIYDDIEVKGKNIDDSIDSLNSLVESKGFDVSKGISVRTTGNISITKKDNITIEYISKDKKDNLLKDLKNNQSINNNSNEDYYSKLWKELKKDQDYGKVYECGMNNDELECYIKDNLFLDHNALTLLDMRKVIQNRKDISRVLNRFGIKNEGTDTFIGLHLEVSNIYIDDIKFECQEDSVCYIANEEDYSIEVSLVKATNGINLLNPNEVLNNVSFINREYHSYIYDSEGNEKHIYLEKKKYCNLNQENCSVYYYRTCNYYEENDLSNCKDIDATKYNEITEVIEKNKDKWVSCGLAGGKLVTKEECYRLLEERQNRNND